MLDYISALETLFVRVPSASSGTDRAEGEMLYILPAGCCNGTRDHFNSKIPYIIQTPFESLEFPTISYFGTS